MKQITIRGIPDEVERIIKREADKKGLSLNKALLSLLEKGAGTKGREKKKKTALSHDLDHLAGVWSKEEAETFERNLKLQRKIDEDLWKKLD